MNRYSAHTIYLGFLWLSFVASPRSANLAAAVIPVWNDVSPVLVTVPPNGTAIYEASGSVYLGTLNALLMYDVSGRMAFDTGQTARNGGMQRGDWAEVGANAFVDSLPSSMRLGLYRFKGTFSEAVPLDSLMELHSEHRLALKTAIAAMPRDGADGTDLTNLIDDFSRILSNAETLDRFEILSIDGHVLSTTTADSAGYFSVPLEILEGDNQFIARTTSSLLNVRKAALIARGVAVPEPREWLHLTMALVCLMWGTRPSRGSRRRPSEE